MRLAAAPAHRLLYQQLRPEEPFLERHGAPDRVRARPQPCQRYHQLVLTIIQPVNDRHRYSRVTRPRFTGSQHIRIYRLAVPASVPGT